MHSRADQKRFGADYHEGIVTAVDADKHRARVKFEQLDGLESDWLAVRSDFTVGNQSYALPDVGTLVGCILDARGESGMVLGGVYNDKDRPPATDQNLWVKQFADGTRIEHNRASGAISISGCNTITINCPTNDVTGNINVSGTITVSGGDVVADGISLKNHVHGGIVRGQSATDKPS